MLNGIGPYFQNRAKSTSQMIVRGKSDNFHSSYSSQIKANVYPGGK